MQSLINTKHVVGLKQCRKYLKEGLVARLYIAEDAAPVLIHPLIELCETSGVETETCPSMSELGAACGIDVGAAVAAILK